MSTSTLCHDWVKVEILGMFFLAFNDLLFRSQS